MYIRSRVFVLYWRKRMHTLCVSLRVSAWKIVHVDLHVQFAALSPSKFKFLRQLLQTLINSTIAGKIRVFVYARMYIYTRRTPFPVQNATLTLVISYRACKEVSTSLWKVKSISVNHIFLTREIFHYLLTEVLQCLSQWS